MYKLVALVMALTLSGCASTLLVAADSQSDIFVNGRHVGKGHGEMRRYGTPGSTTVVFKNPDGTVEQLSPRRKFTLTTLLVGVISYGVCLFLCWEYPGVVQSEKLLVSVRPTPESSSASANDRWLLPPAGWQAPKPPEKKAPSQSEPLPPPTAPAAPPSAAGDTPPEPI